MFDDATMCAWCAAVRAATAESAADTNGFCNSACVDGRAYPANRAAIILIGT